MVCPLFQGLTPTHLGEDLVQVQQVLPYAVHVQRVHERGTGHQQEGQDDQLAEILFGCTHCRL